MSLLVVGSVALDSISTPFGEVTDALGGSAVYFSAAASLLGPVRVVGVVGNDYPVAQLQRIRPGVIDWSGVESQKGESFRWRGKYSFDLSSRETLDTRLGVFANFRPSLPPSFAATPFVFLGNIDPALQRDVLEQVGRPKVVACDTMNFWISGKPEELRRTLTGVDILLINDAEARQLSGEWNIVKAARAIHALGPKTLVIKKGEHGVLMFSEEGSFAAPAYPLEEVFDPTGAGDTFAGGFLGYLAGSPTLDEAALRRAVIMGSTLASFCVEAFSLDRLLTLTRMQIGERYAVFQSLTRFESV